jgi:surface-anchored protein
LFRFLVGGALLSTTLVACASDDEAAPASVPTSPATASALFLAAEEAQAQVDALLLAASSLEDLTRELRGNAALTASTDQPADQLAAVLAELAQAAQQARESPSIIDRGAAARSLSQRAGQLLPVLRKLKRAVAASELAPQQREELTAAMARVRWAATQLNRSAGRYQSLTDPQVSARAEATRGLRNGPLLPGSPFWVIDEGHIDPIDAAFEDGEMVLSIHDETTVPDVEREHEHTLLVVKSEAKLQVPDSRFSFIGAVGQTFWLLPEAQLDAEAAGILWPGLAADEIESGVFVGDVAEFRFKQVIGPDGLSLFSSPSDESSPPAVVVDSENGLPDVVSLPVGSHRHLNWAFESPGVYLVKVDVRGRLDVPGKPWVTSATETIVFLVLP